MDTIPSNTLQNKSRLEYFRQRREQIVTKICAECNNPYQVRRGNDGTKPTYCDSCKDVRRKRFRPQSFLVCQNCGKQFGPVDHLQRAYCSRKCKYEAISARPSPMRGRKRPALERALTLICPSCGTEFRTVKNTKRYHQIYCSHACYLKERRVSHFETRVMDLIESFGIPIERQVKRGRWSFDGAIANTMILIEADGAYWHSHATAKERDERKSAWCKEHGYTLLRVLELEFYCNPVEAIDVVIRRWEKHTGQAATLLSRVEEVAHAR